MANALYRLWLDSGEYDEYAKVRLLDPNGQVTRDGLKLAEALSARIPTKLWLFSDTDDGTPTHCPICSKELDTNVKWGPECAPTVAFKCNGATEQLVGPERRKHSSKGQRGKGKGNDFAPPGQL
jgi:hypothetical protein